MLGKSEWSLFLIKFDAGFSKRLKLKDDAVLAIGSDSNVATHKSLLTKMKLKI